MKKVTSIILCFIMLLSCCVIPCAAAAEDTESSDYPYVFIPGMVGWGTDFDYYKWFPYWGGGFTLGQFDNLIDFLNSNGIEAYAAGPGPFNSAWDRACEVFAALTGSVVDYGEVHSKEHNHDRFGFSYEGKALMGEPWNMQDKINLLGYSFGTEVARLLISLLAFGDEEELAATGENTSALFKGGYSSINACITLSSPHNGTPLANALVDTKLPMMLLATVFHLIGHIFGNNFGPLSLQLGHFGITPRQNAEKTRFSLSKLYNYYKSNDNCGYDMTIRGARELNEKIRLSPHTYYYSYGTYCTVKNEENGLQKLVGNTNWMFHPTALVLRLMEGMTVDGVELTGDWVVNDGVIPLASYRYPLSDERFAKSYEETVAKGETLKKGIWYYMEPIFGMDHFDFCGIEDFPTTMEDFYLELVGMVNSHS